MSQTRYCYRLIGENGELSEVHNTETLDEAVRLSKDIVSTKGTSCSAKISNGGSRKLIGIVRYHNDGRQIFYYPCHARSKIHFSIPYIIREDGSHHLKAYVG